MKNFRPRGGRATYTNAHAKYTEDRLEAMVVKRAGDAGASHVLQQPDSAERSAAKYKTGHEGRQVRTKAVNRRVHDAATVIKDVLGAIAVVNIPVHDEDSRSSSLRSHAFYRGTMRKHEWLSRGKLRKTLVSQA